MRQRFAILLAVITVLGTSTAGVAHPWGFNNHGALTHPTTAGGAYYLTLLGHRANLKVHTVVKGVVHSINPLTVTANVRPIQVSAGDSFSHTGVWSAGGYLEGCLSGGLGCSGYVSGGAYVPVRKAYVDFAACAPPNYTYCYYVSGAFDVVANGSNPLVEVHRYQGPGCGTGNCWEMLLNGGFRSRWDSDLIRGYGTTGSENSAPSAGYPNDTMNMKENDFTNIQVAPEGSGFFNPANIAGDSPHGGACYASAPINPWTVTITGTC